MEAPPEKIDAELLEELGSHKTPHCLSVSAVGQYIEHTLPSEERDGVEKHLKSCLYCLNQLVELRELLFLEKKGDPLPRDLEKRLQGLASSQNANLWINTSSIKDKFLAFWNSVYAWQGATALALVAILVTYLGLSHRGAKDSPVKPPAIVSEPNVVAQPSSDPEPDSGGENPGTSEGTAACA